MSFENQQNTEEMETGFRVEEPVGVPVILEDVIRLARGEVRYSDLLPGDGLQSAEDKILSYYPVVEGSYEMTIGDLRAALTRMEREKRGAADFFTEWLDQLTQSPLDEVLHVPELFGLADADALHRLYGMGPNTSFPTGDADLLEDLIRWMMLHSILYGAKLLFDPEEDEKEAMAEFCRGCLEQLDHYEENRGKSLVDWSLTDAQKYRLVTNHKKNEEYAEFSEEQKKLYRRLLEELAEEEEPEALKILGYACYGDTPLYACDWKRSEKCMKKLLDVGDDETQAQAANTLGYIYFYGRVNDGVPQYDLAYRYFSLACFAGFYEATYKVGDMLAEGLGIPQNGTAAYRLYSSVFSETYTRFQDGDALTEFADAALRMGRCYLNGTGTVEAPFDAYHMFLLAKAAIDIRMKNQDFFGDAKVLAGIEAGLAEADRQLAEMQIDVHREECLVDVEEMVLLLKDGNPEIPIIADLEDGSLTLTRGLPAEFDLDDEDFDDEDFDDEDFGDEDFDDEFDDEEYDPEYIMERIDEKLRSLMAPPIFVTIPEVSFCKRVSSIRLRLGEDCRVDGAAEHLTVEKIADGSDDITFLNGEDEVIFHHPSFYFRPDEQEEMLFGFEI